MADHTPWETRRREMTEMVTIYLTELDGERPTDDEVESVMAVLTGYPEVLWMGLEQQDLIAKDRWDGHDGRRFERRFEREMRTL